MRESLIGYAQSIKIPQVPEDPDQDDDKLVSLPIGTGMPDHHVFLYNKIQDTMTTPYGRLMIFAPPGSAKSTVATVVAPTWYMGNNPGAQIILASYNTELAKKHGSRGRNIVQQDIYQSAFGATISKDTTSKELWSITNGSEYRSAGMQSGITGNRASGVIIDDPIRGRADAESPTIRAKTWNAFRDDLLTRLIPKAWIVLIQTRWHFEDLAGMILPEDWDGESGAIKCRDGMTWEVINMPAKAEREDDPMGRNVGEYLWPEWFDRQHWYQFEPRPDDPYSPSPKSWASLFQGRPKPDVGNEWEADWVQWYDLGQHPEYLMLFTSSDYAVTTPSEANDFDPDWTEHGLGGLDENGDLWIVDWWYGRAMPDITIDQLIKMAKKWQCRRGFGEGGIIRRAIEPTFRQRQRINRWHMSIKYLPSMGDKRARFQPFRALGSAGKVHLPKCPWGERVADELGNFMLRGHDDVADVMALFGRGLESMPWSRERVQQRSSKGVKFGSWEWLTMDTEKDQDHGLDKLTG